MWYLGPRPLDFRLLYNRAILILCYSVLSPFRSSKESAIPLSTWKVKNLRNIKNNKEPVLLHHFYHLQVFCPIEIYHPSLSIVSICMHFLSFCLIKKIPVRCSLISRHLFCEWKNTAKIIHIFAEILYIRCFLKPCSFLITAL